jgi:hypothetical protein
MMRSIVLVTLLLGGCGYVIEPGHRGLLFNPRRGGLQQGVLQAAACSRACCSRATTASASMAASTTST